MLVRVTPRRAYPHIEPEGPLGHIGPVLGRNSLARLRAATSDLHVEAEHYVRILDADATVVDYVRYLRAFHGYHAPIEAVLAPLDAIGFESASRRRAYLAALDLATLDAAPATPCDRVAQATTIAGLVGIAYVIEGSTLGGRFVLAKLPPSLAVLRGRATRFLAGHGDATGARWRAFGGLVESALATTTALDQAIAGARDTFATLVTWLARHEQRALPPLPNRVVGVAS